MHRIASQMMEPSILQQIQSRTASLTIPTQERNITGTEAQNDEDDHSISIQRHHIIQDGMVNYVCLCNNGNIPHSILEQYKKLYGGTSNDTVAQLYAKLQCSISYHDGDLIMTQYI
jgi:hypothetical protein